MSVRWSDGGPFGVIPAWLFDARVEKNGDLVPISDRAVRAYAILARYAGAEGERFQGKQELGAMLGCARTATDKAIAELVGVGALSVEEKFAKNGARIANVYIVHVVSVAGATVPPPPDGGATSQERGATRARSLLGDPTKNLDPSEEGALDAPSQADVQQVYDHWRIARDKNRSNYDRLSSGRRRKIQSRLREFTVDELCAAIDNVAQDPWTDRPLHDDITILLRSREQVDKFLEIGKLSKAVRHQGSLTPRQSAESWVRATGWQYPDADLWEELGRYDLEADEKRKLTDLAIELQTKGN